MFIDLQGGPFMNIESLNNTPDTLELWEELVKSDPNATVIVDGADLTHISRLQADRLSSQIRGWLKEKGIGKDDMVMICLPRGAMAVIAMLGVWKAGAAFVIAETSYPPERIEYIRKNADCRLVIDVDSWLEIMDTKPLPGHDKADLHDAAFAVYTSGSTGNPKGVLHEYGTLKLDILCGIGKNNFKLDKKMRAAHIAPFTFVASIKMIHLAFTKGIVLYILQYETIKNPIKLRMFMLTHKINCTFLVPSLIRMAGNSLGPFLKVVITGSEPANNIYVKGITLINTYSMSESAFTVAEFIIDKPYECCPVGLPNVPEIGLTLLDENDEPVKNGETGEICFENPFFRGYIGLPRETAEVKRGGLYHTADLGRFDENGQLVLAGRKNDMIKINGNRVEPSEIETVARRVLPIKDCVVKGFEERGRATIGLFYTGSKALDVDDSRKRLSEYLPYYMIPSVMVKLDMIPMLPNGKTDRKALKLPENLRLTEYVAPTNDTEKRICDAMAKVLGLEKVGITDDFYEIGGDSLSSMNVLVETGIDTLSALDIFKGRTPQKIASLYEENRNQRNMLSGEEFEKQARERELPLTAMQISMFDRQLYNAKKTMWNLPQLFSSDNPEEADKLCEVINKVIKNHPVFSMVIEFGSFDLPVLRYKPELCPTVTVEEMTEAEFEAGRDKMITLHKLVGKPLFHVRLIKTEKKVYLFFDPHHIIIDGMGYQTLFTDIAKAYKNEPLIPDTYCSYLMENDLMHASGGRYEEDYNFYQALYGDKKWSYQLTPDLKQPGNLLALSPAPVQVSIEEAVKFEKVSKLSRSGLFTIATMFTLSKLNNEENIMVTWAFHNRTDASKLSAVGLLLRDLPLGFSVNEHQTLAELYADIKAQSAYGIEHSSCEWATERESVFENDPIGIIYETASIADQGTLGEIGLTPAQDVASAVNGNSVAVRNMIILVYEFPTMIQPVVVYSKSMYSDDLIKRFSEQFSDHIKKLLSADVPESTMISSLL